MWVAVRWATHGYLPDSPVAAEDEIIPPAQQLFMAQRAGSRIVEVRAGHLSMVSKPGAVTDLIERAARRAT
jgi:hypothetical protein